jgi:hypothetical protein
MTDCCQLMLNLGYFKMDDSQRRKISGFILDDSRLEAFVRIEEKQFDGYTVVIEDTREVGLLATEQQYETGEIILAQLICRQNGRQLLMPRFGKS